MDSHITRVKRICGAKTSSSREFQRNFQVVKRICVAKTSSSREFSKKLPSCFIKKNSHSHALCGLNSKLMLLKSNSSLIAIFDCPPLLNHIRVSKTSISTPGEGYYISVISSSIITAHDKEDFCN